MSKGLKKMAPTTTIEISKLPTEILVKIFSYLDQTDRHFGVARVCKFWLEIVRFHLTEKVLVCNRSGPKSSCDWNIVAEKSWKNVKKLKLIGVSGANLQDIMTATKEFCHNIEEIQIDELKVTKGNLTKIWAIWPIDHCSEWPFPRCARIIKMLCLKK
jgi:hypothetical protein